MSWINDLVSAITGALTGIGNAIFEFLKDGFTTLFLEVDSTTHNVTGVSNFGLFSFVIMGIALALGLTYFIVNLVRRKI